MLEQLRYHATRAGDQVAVREFTTAGQKTTTRRQLYRAAQAVAGRVAALRSSSRPVILVTDNSAASLAVFFGLAYAGMDVLCAELNSSYLADERSAVRRLPAAAIVMPDGHPSPDMPCVRLGYSELIESPGPGELDAASQAATDSTVLQLTSGSTGEPRIACQPVRNISTGGEIYRRLYRYGAEDIVLIPLPVAHSFGLGAGVAASVIAGAQIFLLPSFSLSALYQAMGMGTTVLLGTPLLYRLLVETVPPAGCLASLRVPLSSGGPMAPQLAADVKRYLGRPVYQAYGSTETGLIACQHERAEPWPPDSAGAAVPGVTWRLQPPDGRLLVRTATMFRGYLDGRPAAFVGDLYDTGDIARLDPAGNLHLAGRKETFINVGGRKVNARRIERVLSEHPSVRDVHVFGVASDGEQAVHAAVVRSGGLGAEDLFGFCRSRLTPYEVPHRIYVVDRLPRTGLGKISRTALTEMITERAARADR